MKKLFIATLVAAAAAVPAQAAVFVSSTAGYAGPGFAPSVLYDFNAATPQWNRPIYAADTPTRAQPFGSTGGFASVGPADGTPGVLDLSAIGDISVISVLWGSIDTFNRLEFLDAADVVLFTVFGGNANVAPATGNQADANSNRRVTFNITGSDVTAIAKLRFNATGNAFEFDNVAVGAIPEPASWAMMISGFGLIGSAVRSSRRRRETAIA